MTVTVCWAVKGGAGTTVTVAGLGLQSPTPVTLVDLAGDLPAALGAVEPDGQGLTDWFASDAPPAAIGDLALPIGPRVRVVPRGLGGLPTDDHRWTAFGEWLDAARADVIIDAGTGTPPTGLIDAAPDARRWLVTRACYLALRAASRTSVRPDGVVLVAEPGRRLTARDVAQSLGAPVVATFSVDPAIARAVDAGLLRARLPRLARHELGRSS